MKRFIFPILSFIVFILLNTFYPAKTYSQSQSCTIETSPSVKYGLNYVVKITGNIFGDRVEYTLTADGSPVSKQKGALPLTFSFTGFELKPGQHFFSALPVPPGGGNAGYPSCTAANMTVEPNPDITAPPTLCWAIDANSNKCFDYCVNNSVNKDKGQFETEEKCKTALEKNILITVPPPSSITSTPTEYPTPPPPCSEKDRENGVCKTIQTAIGPIQTDPTSFIKSIMGIFLGLGGGIALLLIIYSGYKLMTSQGNPETIQGARETLTSAIVGLLFIIFSFVILQIIGAGILKIPGFK